jgi:hypothetical protein
LASRGGLAISNNLFQIGFPKRVLTVLPLLLWRLFDEERFLCSNLPGYTEYRKRVRHAGLSAAWMRSSSPTYRYSASGSFAGSCTDARYELMPLGSAENLSSLEISMSNDGFAGSGRPSAFNAAGAGYLFTGPPVALPAGHFGTGHGSRQHAPDEYYVIESSNPAVHGMAEATLSYVKHLYALAGA